MMGMKEYYKFGVDSEAKLYSETSDMMNKRFIPYQNGLGLWIIEDNIEKSVVPIPLFLGFDNEETAKYFCDLLNEVEELKKENEYILKQIKGFREDCYVHQDFNGVSTLNQLLDILEDGKNELIWND